MKKIFKSRIFLILVTAIIFGGVGAFAEASIHANEIVYKSTTLDRAIDELYSKVEDADTYNDKTYTQEGLTIFQDRVTILSGGYYIDANNVVWVNLRLKANTSLTGNTAWKIIEGLPNADNSIIITDTENRFAFRMGYDYDRVQSNVITFFDHLNTTLSQNTEYTLQFKYLSQTS